MLVYRNLLPIQAMTFDLDDTLYDNRPVIRHLDEQITLWLHKNHPVTAKYDARQWYELKMKLLYQNGDLRHDVSLWRFTQIKQGLIDFGYSKSAADAAASDAMVEVNYLRNLVDVPQETHRVLSLLSQKIPLVAITNGNVNAEKIGLKHYFQQVFCAGPDGRSKPDADLFNKASLYLGLPPCSILHVGDHPVTDVFGAINNGFQACWFNDRGITAMQSNRLHTLPHVEVHHLGQLINLLKP